MGGGGHNNNNNNDADLTEWQVQYCSTLRRHIKSVNCARFSHTGNFGYCGNDNFHLLLLLGESIASAGDGIFFSFSMDTHPNYYYKGGSVFLWRRANNDSAELKSHGSRLLEEDEEDDHGSERWITYKTLRQAWFS